MDIVVEGTGKKYYAPNEVDISLDFFVNEKTYEKVVDKGTKAVARFINEVLTALNIPQEELKTRNFRVVRDIRYNYETKKNVDNGYNYSQNAFLKLDYSKDIIAKFIAELSKLDDAPKYTMNFTIKNMEEAKNEVLTEAYNKAREKAEVIAHAAGKNLRDCVKTDFRPFSDHIQSVTSFGSRDFYEDSESVMRKAKSSSVEETILTTFNPEDVLVTNTLYCLWITD